jgi:CRISPR/Cas system-associated exonuclease Cas4 (RecB family)
MPIKAKTSGGKITAWSFSRWGDYEQCPAKAKYKHVDRMKEPGSPAMERGSMIHTLAENFVKGPLKGALPPELKLFGKEFRDLRKRKAICEEQLAFTEKWEKCDWFAHNTWLRVKMDVMYLDGDTLVVIDHKTGKPKDDYGLQLSLYALAGFLTFPSATKVRAALWFLDAGEEVAEGFTRDQVEDLKKDWLKRIKPMFSDTRFAPKPGNYCRWCHFRKGNNGPCQF